jgi:hypothetical protein
MIKNESQPPVGIVEGFYGKEWNFEERRNYAGFLADNGFSFYLYAPKGDAMLRKTWKADWDDAKKNELRNLSEAYRKAGLKFGIGLSLFGVENLPLHVIASDIEKKISVINKIGVDILSVQFDDMRGDIPGLAEAQLNIIHFISKIADVQQIIFCPTYYSYSSSLDRIFGERPENYLKEIGDGLEQKIDIFWTGEQVCSETYPVAHLEEVTNFLKRKPFLWDNYPVNDGKRRSNFLYLLPADRPKEILPHVSGIACNPMNQSFLSRIPLLSLSRNLGINRFKGSGTIEDVCPTLCEEKLAQEIIHDSEMFQKVGLLSISDSEKMKLITKYSCFSNSPFANEIVGWLKGSYAFDERIYEE